MKSKIYEILSFSHGFDGSFELWSYNPNIGTDQIIILLIRNVF